MFAIFRRGFSEVRYVRYAVADPDGKPNSKRFVKRTHDGYTPDAVCIPHSITSDEKMKTNMRIVKNRMELLGVRTKDRDNPISPPRITGFRLKKRRARMGPVPVFRCVNGSDKGTLHARRIFPRFFFFEKPRIPYAYCQAAICRRKEK